MSSEIGDLKDQTKKIEIQESQNDKIDGWEVGDQKKGESSLRQGDLIEFNDTDDPMRQTGIVITADCDLDKRKFARRISLVPVVTVTTLLEQYLLVEYLDSMRGQIENFALHGFGIPKKINRGDKRARLATAIKAIKPDSKNPVHVAALFILGEKPFLTVNEYKILTRNNDRVPAAKHDTLLGRTKDRGDVLHLPDTTRLGVKGNLVWLRDIWQVTHDEIATNNFDAQKLGGQKIARLASPYRYRLTQMLGQVFADIGLPDLDFNRISTAFSEAMKDA